MWRPAQLYLRGGRSQKWRTTISVYNWHTHSKHIPINSWHILLKHATAAFISAALLSAATKLRRLALCAFIQQTYLSAMISSQSVPLLAILASSLTLTCFSLIKSTLYPNLVIFISETSVEFVIFFLSLQPQLLQIHLSPANLTIAIHFTLASHKSQPSLGFFPSPLTVYPDFDSCYSHSMPYRMTPSVRHRAIEVHYDYYYIIVILHISSVNLHVGMEPL